MDESVWDDPPSLQDGSELSSSVFDASHNSHVDEDDGEMELSSSLNLSASSNSDSDDDHTPLFPKANSPQPTTASSSQLSHLTERQQLAYLMRATQQQRHNPSSASKQQAKRHSAPLPPAHPPHNKPKQQPMAPATKQSSKPSLLTHDKKRRRSSTPIAAIDSDDSHIYTVQRLPAAATAPAPLPVPTEYGMWSLEQRRRWDRVSEQPGLYYYHHTAPGIAARMDDWDNDEVELLIHLLLCHPVTSEARKGEASEWGLFSINLPGRVGKECEEKWRELAAVHRLASEDTFDYMQWYERHRVRAKGDAKADAAAGGAVIQPSKASVPVVLNRRRVGAPPPQPAVDNVKDEAVVALQPITAQAVPAATEQEPAVVEGAKQVVDRELKLEPVAVTEKKGRLQRREREKDRPEAREQPPRKKTVRFQLVPAALQPAMPASDTVPVVEPATRALEPLPAPNESAARFHTALSRRPPPARVTIPVPPSVLADGHGQSALWPPRPPRMSIAASPVPSTIRPHPTTSSVTKRLDTSSLSVNTQPHSRSGRPMYGSSAITTEAHTVPCWRGSLVAVCLLCVDCGAATAARSSCIRGAQSQTQLSSAS